MHTVVTFTVLGVAAPQGSKTRTKWGMREDNPRTMPWRQEVAAAAKLAMQGRPIELGPLRLEVTFHFPRPRGHYRTGKNANLLRPSAPQHMTSKPDLSKLVRAVEDAMTGIVYRDDAQLAELQPRKVYCEREPHTRIEVSRV